MSTEAAAPPPPPPPPPGAWAPAPSRLSRKVVIAVFAGVLAGILAVAALVVLTSEKEPPEPPCGDPTNPCAQPPQAPPLVSGELFTSSELGWSVEYDSGSWVITDSDARSLQLSIAAQVEGTIRIDAVPAGEATPQALLDARLAELSNRIVGLVEDTDPTRVVLGPSIGYVDGPGGAYAGTADTPQGPGSPVTLAVMAATDGEITVVVSVIADVGDFDAIRQGVFQAADSVLNTFTWPGQDRG